MVAEIRALHGRADLDSDWLRLSDLENGALRIFLQEDLPRSAALLDYDRKSLCLHPYRHYVPG
jgi:hypothetical protein